MQQPTRPLEPAELAVMAALVAIHADDEHPERWPTPERVAERARMTYAATIGAVRTLAYHHAYVTPRDGAGGLWQDGISLTATGHASLRDHATAAAAAGMPLAAFCEPS